MFTGFELLAQSGIGNLVPGDLSFDQNSLTIALGGTSWIQGASFTAQISAVPLPATLPLLAAGLAALAMARRRRRTGAASA